jgi:hypothetical protein
MLGAGNNLIGRTLLHNLPVFHDIEVLSHMSQHGNVVRNH